jgi:hypothetical protein
LDFDAIDAEVDEMIVLKRKELSFEVKLEMIFYPELDKVTELIN